MTSSHSALIRRFIRLLPKVELHLHLVGSASRRTVAKLARRKADGPVPVDEADLKRYYRFTDFAHFIRVYADVTRLLCRAEDFQLLVTELGGELARQQVRYAEVTVTPYMHLRQGVPETEIIQGIERGRQMVESDFGIRLRWCFDIPGEYGLEAGLDTIRFLVQHRPSGLISFGLGGPEVGVGRAQFRRPFLQAREAGLHSVPHAGETSGPATIWSALNDLGAERIGHGITCMGDSRLVAYLREHQIPLEVCPTSNIRTGQVQALAGHPIRQMIDEGLMVTVNTDDPGMFGIDLNGEYQALARTHALGIPEMAQLAKNGVLASFLDPQAKQQILSEIDATVVAAHIT